MGVVITGIGLCSALGDAHQTQQHLLRGKSGIRLSQPFPALPPLPLALMGDQPQTLPALIPPLVQATLTDASLTPPLPNWGVVVGSSRGCQGNWERMGDGGQPLTTWLSHGPDTGATLTAQILQTPGPVAAPMAACATGLWAIAQGYHWIQQGQCQQVIAGAVEAPITPLTLAGFARMGALAQTGCYPFDQHREGLVLGEGGALFCLESQRAAQARGAQIYGEIIGVGFTCDAYHVSAPDPSGQSARAAIVQCLERARLTPAEIDYIHAHGTSTQRNDQQEAAILSALFPHRPPVSSTKGATGHTLGASGALGVAVCLWALRSQTLPPSVGLRDLAFPELNIVRQATKAQIHHTLCLSFGFGGQNLALTLRG
ncbi:beta-ketoacyl-ACP synthase [Spirulina sp. CCNP1310]|uniref:beta-ketoacyl-ACP synthase n=1 Tax=Spirulina sp. CCNP1310 TaxID=3110249 RepID=UPI002B20EA05|nr:beta-ketoacyl-ACP synthase [Spirulina sp. CCNP1310]MEA5420325.1 beta-ketoacyl-ACP synthase [Spirulina sp. CCNP1310]